MTKIAQQSARKPAFRPMALALVSALALSGCIGGVPTNRSLYSENQPVVSRTNYVFDVQTSATGVPSSEQRRLTDWFDALELGYGDKVSVDSSGISAAARDDLFALADQEGFLLKEGAPLTEGMPGAGVARVVVTRAVATVPNCPNWSANSDSNPNNATSPGYGCAVNGNLAAMIADPEDLLRGQRGTGETVVMTNTKAIDAYRSAEPTGGGNTVTAVASDSK
ncbi:CpaD family pilus assembly lipoprotein [Croceicoccus naphthovorans]|uniref:CpaD family pilus assembly lipoprotein n=1 Tax=Croceicoccus naphthovorans TaxID=1348774 RepID=UPI000AAFA12E|nr:CpaD family pilus assembly lipoprotein [Croceicoccus naphthovorans]MBB3989000.1 pilus assembly protein CpaD [Croceicoccus naphthovorans]